MARHKGTKGLAALSPVTTGILVGLGFLVPASIVCGMLYFGGVNAIHEEIRGNLQRVAKTAALLVDPELHKTFTDPSQESSPEYERAIAPLRKFVESDANFKYVYTYVERDGKIYFVLDPTPAGDVNGDGVDEKSHIMDYYDEDGLENMLKTAQQHVPAAEDELDSDQWGTFLSAYAPIYDKQGEYVASIGVDIAVDHYAARLAHMRSVGLVSAFTALCLSLCVGLAGGVFQKRRQEFTDVLTAANVALQATADSLDNANAQLRVASRRFEQLFNLLPVACFTVDRNGTIFEWNRESERLFGRYAHDVVQKRLVDIVSNETTCEKFRWMIEDINADRPTKSFEWTDLGSYGRGFTVVVSSFPIYAKEGVVTGGIIACADITVRKQLQDQFEGQMAETRRAYEELTASRNELTRINDALSQANERLKELATIDGLTGVLNRRSVFELLEKEISHFDRTARPLSILMVDIDHFKLLNDAHGHIVGDAVLREVAGRLSDSSRKVDTVGRFGGEEFFVLMPETDAEKAVQAAERMRKAVVESGPSGIPVTVSIGVSTFQPEFGTVEQFIDAADRALYEAKHRGRNRVVHSREITEGAA